MDEPQKLKSVAELMFDPVPLTGNVEKMFKEGWLLAVVKNDISNYYNWFVKRRHGLILMHPAWGPHISVLRGEGTRLSKTDWNFFKKKYNRKRIEFEYEVSPKTNGRHWWLRVTCEELKDIREEMGYHRDSRWGLHLTLGMPIPLHKENSYRIWRMYENETLNDSKND